jgi:hypothetical protein
VAEAVEAAAAGAVAGLLHPRPSDDNSEGPPLKSARRSNLGA